jgi:hypothetical protein
MIPERVSLASDRPRTGLARLLGACILLGVLLSGVGASAQTWRNPADGSVANTADISECRIDARREALNRYPLSTPPGLPGGTSMGDDTGRRFAMESSLFDQCMRRKGYQRGTDQ